MQRMRQSGNSLQQIGDRFGISRERVRRLLTKHYGSTRVQELLTPAEVARLAGCNYRHMVKLTRGGVIQPAMVVGRQRTLWQPATVAAIVSYIDRHRCRVCHRPLPSDRQVYCCHTCYLEARRYKNRPEAWRRRHKERVARWKASHQEQVRQIQLRAERKYRAKKKAPSTSYGKNASSP